jgi:hypothetical protein
MESLSMNKINYLYFKENWKFKIKENISIIYFIANKMINKMPPFRIWFEEN